MMYVYVSVETNAKKECLSRLDESHFDISVMEPPKRGEANKAIVGLLTRYYRENGIKARVRFVHGATSEKKIFDVTYVS